MRLDDLRRNVRDETDIPAEVERELEILDAALRGEAVPEGMEGIEALVSDLRAERPEPEPRFEEKLDAWAAAGFPRGKGPRARAAGGGGKSTGGFFCALQPRRAARLGAARGGDSGGRSGRRFAFADRLRRRRRGADRRSCCAGRRSE